MFLRLTLTYHISNALSRGDTIRDAIGPDVAQMAAMMLIDYSLPTAHNFYKELGYSGSIADHSERMCNECNRKRNSGNF